MRVFLILTGLVALVVGGGVFYFRAHPGANPMARFTTSGKDAAKGAIDVAPPSAPVNQVTLYLVNGGVVTGELVRETPQEVTLRWDYGDVGFQRAEIRSLVTGKQDTGAEDVTLPWEGEHAKVHWPYAHNVVVKLMRGTVVDGAITAVTPTAVTLTQQLPGGGAIEHTVRRADLEGLLFKPIRNERSTAIEQHLKTVFPAMSWHEEGMVTIVTDSTPPMVKAYRRTIRELMTDWYLAFSPLVRTRSPTVQQYVVIFENWDSYIDYAATDGLPGWLAVGYFNPEDEVLYCFNMLGERFSELLYDAYLGRFRNARDEFSTQLKGSRDELFIEGQISEFLQKLETAHGMVRQLFRQFSTDVLRHELTHGLFHNWRLQGVVLSQMSEKAQEALEKKRTYLQSTNEEEKRQLLDELLAQKPTIEVQDRRAANSWYVEGLAGYMEPTPLGDFNRERLSELQEARERQQIFPLEFLDAFRMGGFLSMATQSALYAYAQSWAMCHFLMHRYPDGFLRYLERLASSPPQEGEDTLAWLLEATGKELRPLEQEFLAYLDQFPHEDPLWLKQMQAFLDLRQELITLLSRL